MENGHDFSRPRLERFRPRVPLIAQVKNEWMTNPKYGYVRSPPSPLSPLDRHWTIERVLTPKVRRHLLLFLAISISTWVVLARLVRPRWQEHNALVRAFDQGFGRHRGWYGVNALPEFADLIHMKTLDSALVPMPEKNAGGHGKHHHSKDSKKGKGEGSGQGKRLIVIGDVHGCKTELLELLDKVSFSRKNDHLIFAGDLVSKGPDSAGVVDLARSLKASCVRGNHEDRVLLAHKDLHSKHVPHVPSYVYDEDEQAQGTLREHAIGDDAGHADEGPSLAQQERDGEGFLASNRNAKDRALARTLSPASIEYLQSCPVILRVGASPLPGMGSVVVVHGGLVPGVPLQRQDPLGVMTMRTMNPDTHVPSENRDGGLPWTKLWNYYQATLPASERSTVVFGHDSKRGLKLDRYTKGIDSGCVAGGKLSALVIGDGGGGAAGKDGKRGEVAQRVVSVRCKDYRALETTDLGAGTAGKRPAGEALGYG